MVDVLIQDGNREYPICIDGENASPPEDVGGITGYKRMVEAFFEGNHHPDYDEYKKWLGIEMYDAESFDINYINKKIKELSSP